MFNWLSMHSPSNFIFGVKLKQKKEQKISLVDKMISLVDKMIFNICTEMKKWKNDTQLQIKVVY